jgi:flagellar basal-body rod protein FlgB
MALNLDSYLATRTQAVSLRAHRAQLLASNLANGDTPNYKARDFDFATALKQLNGEHAAVMRPTHSAHIGARGVERVNLGYRVPTQASLDGNTVESDLERARFAENALRYQASLQMLNSRITGLIKVIRGE